MLTSSSMTKASPKVKSSSATWPNVHATKAVAFDQRADDADEDRAMKKPGQKPILREISKAEIGRSCRRLACAKFSTPIMLRR